MKERERKRVIERFIFKKKKQYLKFSRRSIKVNKQCVDLQWEIMNDLMKATFVEQDNQFPASNPFGFINELLKLNIMNNGLEAGFVFLICVLNFLSFSFYFSLSLAHKHGLLFTQSMTRAYFNNKNQMQFATVMTFQTNVNEHNTNTYTERTTIQNCLSRANG